MKSKNLYLIAHNIRSLFNVGSLFRTADCAGARKIFLTGYTGSPADRFGKIGKEIHKTALGAETYLDWEKTKNFNRIIAKLKTDNIFVTALELSPRAVSYLDFGAKFRKEIRQSNGVALVVGNEVRGLAKNILRKCDAVMQIPMKGKKESLNAAVAAGVALFKAAEWLEE